MQYCMHLSQLLPDPPTVADGGFSIINKLILRVFEPEKILSEKFKD